MESPQAATGRRDEIHFDVQFSPGVESVEDHLESMEQLYEMASAVSAR